MSALIEPNAEPIPGYRLLERLGRGGYGEVWKCEAPGGIHKAIKFVFGDMEGFGAAGEAAEQEYRSLNRVKTIRHPYILSLERFDIINGQLLIVMELADRNLWDRFNECVLRGMPGIPHDELLKYLEEAAEALDLMNGHYQIQHLDIKPQNLFLVHNHIKVADFGLAKDLEGARAAITGGVTPTYAPPETFEGWVSRHSDQYSLAIVYQEMLTGRRPFNGTNTRQLIMQHISAQPDLSSLNERNRDAVGRALSKIPTDRFPTCTDFVRALKGTDTPPRFAEDLTDQVRQMMTPKTTSKRLVTGEITPRARELGDDPDEASNRKLPALVTPGLRDKPSLSTPNNRPKAPGPEVRTPAQGSHAAVEQLGNGVLFPALYIGLGGAGLKTLVSLRSMLEANFGLDRLPNSRFLAIDTDPASVEGFIHAGGWETEEVILARLQRPAHYFNREGMPKVEGWLPTDLLYQMPRSLLTEGNRAFGRLAFCDHYPLICQRIRMALESFARADGLNQADKLTQLGFRSNMPRVYLVGSIAGGTASGMVIDLAYLVRRELRARGFVNGQVLGLLALPPSRSTDGSHNARVTLGEINHFEQRENTYRGVFDTREEPLVDPERPFRRCQLVFDADTAQAGNNLAQRMAGLLFAESFIQAGRLAHPDNGPPPNISFCVSAMARAMWPHHVLLEAGCNQLTRLILGDWSRPGDGGLKPYLKPMFENTWAERGLPPDHLRGLLYQALVREFGCPPVELIAGWLQPFRARNRRNPREAEDLLKTIHQILEVLGRVGTEEEQYPGQLSMWLQKIETAYLKECDSRLITAIVSLIEQPGLRLTAADEFIRYLEGSLTEHLEWADRELGRLEDGIIDEFGMLFAGAGVSHNTSLMNLGKRLTGGEQSFGEVMKWVERRIALLLQRRVLSVYRNLRTNLPEYVRDVQQCRKQLGVYIGMFADDPKFVAPAPEGVRMYFGEQATTLSGAVNELLGLISQENRRDLEQTLQAKIRHEGRGLVNMCVKHKEFGQAFVQLLKEQSRRLLEPLVVAYAAGMANWRSGGEALMASLFDETKKQLASFPGSLRPSITVTGIPSSADHATLLSRARETTAGSPFVPVETPDSMWVYRESRSVDPSQFFTPIPGTTITEDPKAATRHARSDVPWHSS